MKDIQVSTSYPTTPKTDIGVCPNRSKEIYYVLSRDLDALPSLGIIVSGCKTKTKRQTNEPGKQPNVNVAGAKTAVMASFMLDFGSKCNNGP